MKAIHCLRKYSRSKVIIFNITLLSRSSKLIIAFYNTSQAVTKAQRDIFSINATK